MENTDPQTPVGAKRRRFTETERSAHLAAWRLSGDSARVYCAAHGLSPASLFAWSRKARASRRAPTQRSGSAFVPVRISGGGMARESGLRVTLRTSTLECVIEGAHDAGSMAALAAALKREVLGV